MNGMIKMNTVDHRIDRNNLLITVLCMINSGIVPNTDLYFSVKKRTGVIL